MVQERLARWQVTISRREVLYLSEAYCSLLRAAQDWSADSPWRAAVEANGGLLLALDGIQPDKGHETIYLIRDLLSGQLLGARNLLSSEAQVIQEVLLVQIAAWGLPVLGVLTDGQESLLQQVAFLAAPAAGMRAAIDPPTHMRHRRWPAGGAASQQQQTEPVPAGDEQRTAKGMVKARLDMREALGLARAHHA